MLRWRAWLQVLALGLVWCHRAEAQPESPLELTYVAGPGCPDGSALRADVLRLARVAADTPRHVKARIAVEQLSDVAWTLTLTTTLAGETGERVLSGGTCRSVTDAAALTLALVLNPEVNRAPEPARPAALDAGQPSRSAAPGVGGATPRLRLLGALQAGVNAGIFSHAVPEAGLGLGAASGRASVWLSAGYGLPHSEPVAGRSGVGGRLWLGSLTALGCFGLDAEQASWGPCLGVALTRIDGHGFGVSAPRQNVAYWVSGGAGLSASLPLGRRLSASLRGLVLVPFARPTVGLDQIGTVLRPGEIAGTLLAGLDFDFL